MLSMARRTFAALMAGVAAAPAIAAPLPRKAIALRENMIRLDDGTWHGVRAAWFERHVLGAGVMAQDERRRLEILRLSEKRPLRPEEVAELEALTQFKNMNKRWELMRGRHYNELGLETIDQVKHNSFTSSACGCEVNYIWDAYTINDTHREHHPHYPTRICEAHAHLSHDFRAHFKAVTQG